MTSYFVFILLLLGNILVILTVVKVFKTRNVTNMFICSLAVADLLVSVVCIPFRVSLNLMSLYFRNNFCELKKGVLDHNRVHELKGKTS